MNRRSFLKSLAALAASPAIAPVASGLALAKTSATGAVAASSATYKWAEVIVRAHNSCTTAMLQRHLGLDGIAAQALQKQLISNGVVAAQANAYGIRTAVKPLNDMAFLKPGGGASSSTPAAKQIDKVLDVASDKHSSASNEAFDDTQQLAMDMREADDMDCELACIDAISDDKFGSIAA